MDAEFKQRKMNTKIVATVHDSVELISPDNEVEDAIKILHHHMTEYPYIKEHFDIKFSVPLEIEIMVGSSFGSGEEYHISSPTS
jgi:DNA polymerase I-like protein with 3'-5' exonuclease and polymerase domains